jgi:nicotinamidase-related amidase
LLISRMVDPLLRTIVSVALRRDRLSGPDGTAMLVLNAAEGAPRRDDLLATRLGRVVARAREAGIPIVFANTASASDLAEPAPLEPRAGDLVLDAQERRSAFAATDLDRELRERGVEHVILSGFLTNIDVDSTARHAAELGYHVTTVSDTCAASSEEEHSSTVAVTLPRVVHELLSATELLGRLRVDGAPERAGRAWRARRRVA